jgi:hypothetical protein
VGFDVADQNLCIHQILEKKWEYSETVHQLFIDFKKAYDLVRRKLLYSILTEFGVPMKLVFFSCGPTAQFRLWPPP